MNSLHPTVLFHFTSKNNLFNILQNTFQSSYARESIRSNGITKEFGVPMVSFCDIKLSDIKHFISREDGYGKYGIGMSKEWANGKMLNPVLYMNEKSDVALGLMKGLETFFKSIGKANNDNISNEIKAYHSVLNLYRYIKSYEGKLWRQGEVKDPSYRFADEKEWRYVPNFDTKGISPIVPIESINTPGRKTEMNRTLVNGTLKFSPDDIKYLIVEKETDIPELMDKIELAEGKYSPEFQKQLFCPLVPFFVLRESCEVLDYK